MSKAPKKEAPAYLTLGIERLDGDFQVLATLNNADNLMDRDVFESIARNLTNTLASATDEQTKAVIRQDVPDYIEAEDAEVFTQSVERNDDTVRVTSENSSQFLYWLLNELHGGNQFSKADFWKWAEQARVARDAPRTQKAAENINREYDLMIWKDALLEVVSDEQLEEAEQIYDAEKYLLGCKTGTRKPEEASQLSQFGLEHLARKLDLSIDPKTEGYTEAVAQAVGELKKSIQNPMRYFAKSEGAKL